MTAASVRIRYRRSGGLAGLDLTTDALSDELAPEHAGIARALLDRAPAPAAGAAGAGAADQFSYVLDLDDGARHRTLRWAEPEVPETVRPLLSALNHRAHPAPPA